MIALQAGSVKLVAGLVWGCNGLNQRAFTTCEAKPQTPNSVRASRQMAAVWMVGGRFFEVGPYHH